MAKLAINGFGRIGRLFFRQVLDDKNLEVVAVNDLGEADQLAYLLEYDTVYGRLGKKVGVRKGELSVGSSAVKVFSERDPSNLPWKKLGVDVVVEATGAFTTFSKAQAHLRAGAKRVVITAPAKGEEGEAGRTVLMGVNEEALASCRVSSNGSCTTNAAAAVMRILHEAVGVEKAFLSTTHGYTASQNLVDGPGKKDRMRRGRAAAQNIVPSTTGAAAAVTRAFPELEGRFDGVALRVPVIAGSVAGITFLASRDTTVQEVNDALEKAASDKRYEGIIKVTKEPVVSSDIVGEPYGAILDLDFTRVVGGKLVQVLSWYDNEWGYVATLVRHVKQAVQHI